jgi:hypothetical protein
MSIYCVVLRAEWMTRPRLLAVIAPTQILASFRRRFRFQIRKIAFKQRETALLRRSISYVTSIAMRGAQRSR